MRPDDPSFLHHRLDAYWTSLDLAVACKAVADAMPRGYRTLADQLTRASVSVVTLITEGRNQEGLPHAGPEVPALQRSPR
jgi:hypothetical protein